MKSLKSAKVGDIIFIVENNAAKTATIRRVTKTQVLVGPFRGRCSGHGLIRYNKKTGFMAGGLKHNPSEAFATKEAVLNRLSKVSSLFNVLSNFAQKISA